MYKKLIIIATIFVIIGLIINWIITLILIGGTYGLYRVSTYRNKEEIEREHRILVRYAQQTEPIFVIANDWNDKGLLREKEYHLEMLEKSGNKRDIKVIIIDVPYGENAHSAGYLIYAAKVAREEIYKTDEKMRKNEEDYLENFRQYKSKG